MEIWNSLSFLIWGIGLFLYGLVRFEESIERTSGNWVKKAVSFATKNLARGISTGFVGTAILQSSTLVSIIVIGLVGAQTMNLFQAAGIILWANIGTTLTAWFVALWGFKINIAVLALPFVWLGGLTAVISKKHSNWRGRAIFLLGFGMILLWLSYMKDSFAYIQNVIDLSAYHDLPMLFFLFFSIGLTIVVQSSTVATTIILAAMYSHAITFDAGLAMIVWANIGTTFTAILWSLGGIAQQKQIAAFHVLFNVITGTIIYISLPVWDRLLMDVLKFTDPVVALAAFHSMFSIFGVILFVPILHLFLGCIEKLFPQNGNFWDRFPRIKKLFVMEDLI